MVVVIDYVKIGLPCHRFLCINEKCKKTANVCYIKCNLIFLLRSVTCLGSLTFRLPRISEHSYCELYGNCEGKWYMHRFRGFRKDFA